MSVLPDLLTVAREVYTDEVVSEMVGHPVRVTFLMPPHIDGEELSAHVVIGPASLLSVDTESGEALYSWGSIGGLNSTFPDGAEVEKAVRGAADLWKRDCLPNVETAGS